MGLIHVVSGIMFVQQNSVVPTLEFSSRPSRLGVDVRGFKNGNVRGRPYWVRFRLLGWTGFTGSVLFRHQFHEHVRRPDGFSWYLWPGIPI